MDKKIQIIKFKKSKGQKTIKAYYRNVVKGQQLLISKKKIRTQMQFIEAMSCGRVSSTH